jgi:hypothetical protein
VNSIPRKRVFQITIISIVLSIILLFRILPEFIFFHISEKHIVSIEYSGSDDTEVLGQLSNGQTIIFPNEMNAILWSELQASNRETGYAGWLDAGEMKLDFGLIKYRLILHTNSEMNLLFWKFPGGSVFRNDELALFLFQQ